jgi:hypothetical protein
VTDTASVQSTGTTPRVLADGRTLRWWVEIIGIAAYYGIYSLIRNTTNADPSVAFAHARTIVKIERNLHIYVEAHLNHWALHVKPIVIMCNYFYGSLHFIVTIGAAIFLFHKFPHDYPRWRNTLGVATAIGLIGFATFALMPPRLLDCHLAGFAAGSCFVHGHVPPVHYGFVDTLAKYPTFWSFNSGAMSKLSNQFAAMPSIHCCWALWCACVFVPRVRNRGAKIAAACYPLLTVTVIVLTANHYLLDAVAGFSVLGLGYLVAYWFDRIRRVGVAMPLARAG